LNHGNMRPDVGGGDPIPMMSFVPVGLLSLRAYADKLGLGADIRVTEVNGLINAGKIPNDDEFYEHLVDTILDGDDAMVGCSSTPSPSSITWSAARARRRSES
jgi:hypothetical protein